MSTSKKEEYLNKEFKLLDGNTVKIIFYDTCKNVVIEFNYGYKVKTTMNVLKRGVYKHPNMLTVYNIGYIGVGKYTVKENKVLYDKWKGMLRRCYSEKDRIKYPTYKDVTVCDEWLDFQVFATWFDKNYVDGWELDKDILVKGNKTYSPETCCFVPHEINSLFIKRQNDRGKCPIGVSYNKRDNLYGIILPKNKKGKRNFKTEGEAFQMYKETRESYIKEIADKWLGQITEEVYQTLINYKVEITD